MEERGKIKSALVTGASKGLGFALASEMAEGGWNLVIDARNSVELADAQDKLAVKTKVIAIPGDISDPHHREKLRTAAHELRGLDAVINNAGILGASPLPKLLDYPLDQLAEVFRINTLAQLGILQALRSEIKPGARILNITSDAGVNAYPGWGGYGSAKAALEQLSAVLAVEQPDWRVYSLDPGDMRTEMHQAAYPGEDISDRPLPEESVAGIMVLLEGQFPSGRYIAKDLAPATSP